MGLRFILGRAKSAIHTRPLQEVKEKLIRNPKGSPIFYIVPDQMTFQQEYALFRDDHIRGSMRAQVVSFSRLAWRVLQDTGGGTKQFISSVGIHMVLKKIMNEKETPFNVFQKAKDKYGFLIELENLITEFKRYRITPELLDAQLNHLNEFVHQEKEEKALANKLEDLSYIYNKLVMTLQDSYIDSEDQLQLLAEKINESPILTDAEIYLEGFHRFSPQEYYVIEQLLKTCKQVTVALTMETDEIAVSELDLFYQPTETYDTLKAIATENNVPIDDEVILKRKGPLFLDHPAFQHLDVYFDRRPAPPFKEDAPVHIAEAVHVRAEVEGVAQEIIRLVREDMYRFKDIAIYIREPEVYNDLITTIFKDFEIPVFMDEKESMLYHPLIEFIRSLLEMVENNWPYDAVFRVLKTGFIPSTNSEYPLTLEAMDELENYVLEYGIRTREKWFSNLPWNYQRFYGFERSTQTDNEKEIQYRINKYREQVVQALQLFDEHMRKATTVREKCECIYLLMERLQITDKLETMRTYFDNHGQLEKGREQDQVWDALIELLDELVEIAGEESISLEDYRAILDAGFESLTFSHVPPSIDQVIVGTVGHSRMSEVKCTFLLGVNEGAWPMKPPVDGMINEQERALLKEHGIELAESSERKLLDDWYDMYLAFTSPTDYLWISYPLSDEDGNTKLPSSLITRIKELFPTTKNIQFLDDPDDLFEADRFITTPYKTTAALTAQLARYKRGYPIKDIWWHVLNWYIKNETKSSPIYTIVQSIYYENKPKNLSKETVKELYPKEMNTSVSRLEMYYRCSYQHFAQYGLGLKERRTYKLDAPDIGQLFHEALKTITDWINKEGRDFSDVTEKEANQYAQKAITHLAPILQNEILRSSNRYKYIEKKLLEVITRATYILSEQARRSGFTPVGLELAFGKGETLNPVRIQLPNGYELLLRGRIDRVDKGIFGNELYLRIIDYKSSNTDLNLIDVYYGLALQMLTYLDVVLTQSEAWLGKKGQPAGMLYFHVHNAMLSEETRISDEKINHQLFKKYKMNGLLLSNKDIVQLMDSDLESGSSSIIPAGFKNDGQFNAYSKIADYDTFSNLQTYIHYLIQQAGVDMTSGMLRLNPYEFKQKSACTFCSFKSLCQFDPILEENRFRKLTNMKEKDILNKIKEEAERGSKHW